MKNEDIVESGDFSVRAKEDPKWSEKYYSYLEQEKTREQRQHLEEVYEQFLKTSVSKMKKLDWSDNLIEFFKKTREMKRASTEGEMELANKLYAEMKDPEYKQVLVKTMKEFHFRLYEFFIKGGLIK